MEDKPHSSIELYHDQFGSRFDVLEEMIDDVCNDDDYRDTPQAMRAMNIALDFLQTARMWVNKALYTKEDK